MSQQPVLRRLKGCGAVSMCGSAAWARPPPTAPHSQNNLAWHPLRSYPAASCAAALSNNISNAVGYALSTIRAASNGAASAIRG